LYSHFPDERSLFLACSGLALERDPLPEAEWTDIADARERLRSGLTAIYGWYARNERLAACVLRDAEHHAMTREIAELRFGPPMIAYRRVLGAGLNTRQQALLAVALGFHAWRNLAHEAQLPPAAAADVFAEAIVSLTPAQGLRNAGRATRRGARTRRGTDPVA
jgi:AcrR family transcriptional regulator